MDYADIDLLSTDEGRNVVNSALYHGGMVDKKGGHFHPLNYALGLAKAATDAGVQIFVNKRVICVKEQKDKVWAGVEGGNVFAKQAMLATDTKTAGVNRHLEKAARAASSSRLNPLLETMVLFNILPSAPIWNSIMTEPSSRALNEALG